MHTHQVDTSGIRLLDLTALSCMLDVVDDAQRHGIAVVFADCSAKLKASLKACGLYRRVGGPLTRYSAEEVYLLLVEAPHFMPQLANQSTSSQQQQQQQHQLPPRVPSNTTTSSTNNGGGNAGFSRAPSLAGSNYQTPITSAIAEKEEDGLKE